MNQNPKMSYGGQTSSRLLWTIKSRLWLIFAFLVMGILTGYFASSVVPKYKASAQILFDPSWSEIPANENAFMPAILTIKALERAIALVQSPQILKQVAQQLSSDEKFKDLNSDTSVEKILHSDAEEPLKLRRLMVLLGKSLKVKTEGADQIIIIEYQSESPQEAAYITNLIARTFIGERAEDRKEALSQVTDWLDQRVLAAKDKLVELDKKIHDYQAEHKISGSGSTEYETQLSHLREQLSLLLVKLSSTESVYRALQPYKAGGSEANAKLAEVVNDEVLNRLRATLTDAEAQEAAAKSKLGQYHPDVQARHAQIQVIRQEIGAAARRKLEETVHDLETLHVQEKNLRTRIEEIEQKVNDVRESEVPLRELQRERDATKTLYDASLLRLTQTAPQQARSLSEFKLLLDASVPEHPKIPPLAIWLGMSLLGLALGVGTSFLLDYFNQKLVHIDGLEQSLGVRVLACVPLIKGEDFADGEAVKREGDSSNYLHFAKDHPESLFTNCLINAEVAIGGRDRTGEGSVVMVTSPMQGNGKTLISTNLACLSALLGKKTLYIALDCRKGIKSGEDGGEANNPKLHEFLEKTRLNQVVLATNSAGQFDVVRPSCADEAAWIQIFQPSMNELLNFARIEYDQVWIDTPPVQIFADALMLVKQTNGVIVVAEWSKTTKRDVMVTIDLIQKSGGKIIGVLMNKVKVDVLISKTMFYYKDYYARKKKSELS